MLPLLPPLATSISPVLRQAAELKIEELNRTKAQLKNRYADNAAVAAAGDDKLKRLEALLDEIKKNDPYLERDDDLPVLSRYVEQAKNDRSVSKAKIERWEKELMDKLAKHENRLEVASLHVALMNEALAAADHAGGVVAKMEKVALDDHDEFEMVEGDLEDVVEKFEKNTFSKKEVDEKAIEEYLNSIFEKDAAKEELEKLRRSMEDYGNDVMTGSEEVDEDMVTWCIVDLLKNGLLSDEKKKMLQGYLQSLVAIRELTSTLNMKSVRHWNWRNPEKGLPVMARQNAEGKYAITVEEDMIDMLFLHTIAVGWSMKLREELKDVISYKSVWPGNKLLSGDELDKREYYLQGPRRPLPKKDCNSCRGPPPPPPAPMIDIPPPPPGGRGMPPPPPPMMHWKAKKKRGGRGPPLPPAPFAGGPNINDERYRNYIRDFFLPRLPKRNGSCPESVSPNETQAILLKTLATEAKLREALDGSAFGVQANFEAFASTLPHKTILTVLKFIGVPQQWLDVFTRFLAGPLNMGPVVRGTSDQILTRTCGVPIAHGLETFFGEAVLFFLDVAVHQKTSAYLYRLRDKCYFVGNLEQRDTTISELSKFSKAMHLTVDTIPHLDANAIGFLNISLYETDEDKTTAFIIEDAKVKAYARRVKKQLSACSTVFEWIRTWNSTMGTYASHLFGPLANVFGKAHVDAVTASYNLMHSIIFDGDNLTTHMQTLLSTHLNRSLSDPPFALEPLLYLSPAYGGLGMQNPYITLQLARNVIEKPDAEFAKYKEAEQKYYECAAENFARMTPDQRDTKLSSIFADDKQRIANALGATTDTSVFFSIDELRKTRERAAYPFLPPPPYPAPLQFCPMPALIPTYTALLEEPVDSITASDRITDEVFRLAGTLDMKRWSALSAEDQWVLQMYGEECFERYGGFELWHGESVPIDVLKMVRGETPGEDDDSTVSSVSIVD